MKQTLLKTFETHLLVNQREIVLYSQSDIA